MEHYLTGFDQLVFAIIFISTAFAIYKGFIRSFLSLFGWIFAAIGSYYINPFTKVLLTPMISNTVALAITTPLVTYITLMLLLKIIGNVLAPTPNTSVAMVDRILGGAFGVMRGVIFSSIIFFCVSFASSGSIPFLGFNQKDPVTDEVKWLSRSLTYPYLKSTTKFFSSLMPASLIPSINNDSKPTDQKPADVPTIFSTTPTKLLNKLSPYLLEKVTNNNLSPDETNMVVKALKSILSDQYKAGELNQETATQILNSLRKIDKNSTTPQADTNKK